MTTFLENLFDRKFGKSEDLKKVVILERHEIGRILESDQKCQGKNIVDFFTDV